MFTVQEFHKTFDPFSIGFSHILDDIAELNQLASKQIQKYPPYNIKKVTDEKWVVEMAVAGFAKSDIELTLDGDKLTIKGAAKEDDSEGQYMFKGIANRDFSHTFKLADQVKIGNAELINGMLKVWLEQLVKTQDNIKKIAIN